MAAELLTVPAKRPVDTVAELLARGADVEFMDDDEHDPKRWFATVEGCPGAWGVGETKEAAVAALEDCLPDWLARVCRAD